MPWLIIVLALVALAVGYGAFKVAPLLGYALGIVAAIVLVTTLLSIAGTGIGFLAALAGVGWLAALGVGYATGLVLSHVF